jgi:hypothetical protein
VGRVLDFKTRDLDWDRNGMVKVQGSIGEKMGDGAVVCLDLDNDTCRHGRI